MSQRLREALAVGTPLFGAWMQMSNTFEAELLGRIGFDWVGLDTQHGMIGYEGMLGMLQALSISGVPGVVRVSDNSPGEIMRALDAGAQGVIVPQVETREQVEQLVAAARYHPLGTRSYNPIRAAFELEGYTPATGSEYAVCIPQVESVRGVDNIEEILSVPGIDVLYVGPSDLAVSAGLPPGLLVEHPDHVALMDRIVNACEAYHVPIGTHPPGPTAVGEYVQKGYRMLATYLDVPMLRNGAAAALAQSRECAA